MSDRDYMDENTFWLGVWRAIITGICVLAVAGASCTIHADKRIADVIKAGADPIDAHCAFNGIDNTPCALRAAQPRK